MTANRVCSTRERLKPSAKYEILSLFTLKYTKKRKESQMRKEREKQREIKGTMLKWWPKLGIMILRQLYERNRGVKHPYKAGTLQPKIMVGVLLVLQLTVSWDEWVRIVVAKPQRRAKSRDPEKALPHRCAHNRAKLLLSQISYHQRYSFRIPRTYIHSLQLFSRIRSSRAFVQRESPPS